MDLKLLLMELFAEMLYIEPSPGHCIHLSIVLRGETQYKSLTNLGEHSLLNELIN